MPLSPALRDELRSRIIRLHSAESPEFESVAMAVFHYQAASNPVYRRFIEALGVEPERVRSTVQIPFLPISFFKHHLVLTAPASAAEAALVFESSGTTGSATSRHYVSDPALYDTISIRTFEHRYGPLDGFHILALLPSYLERNNSSLVYMVQRFIEKTGSGRSGFFLKNTDDLTATLRHLAEHPDGRRILLIGVTFALLDWAESGTDLSFLGALPQLTVMETGGMKGRRRELLREEVHDILTRRLGVAAIHSEYGMTELLSQAYAGEGGIFRMSPTLRILLRDVNDPFEMYFPSGPGNSEGTARRTGGINVIDLGNLDSCSFIETQDLGQYEAGRPDAFRVIGRFDNSDIRGCNLLVL